MRPRRTPHSTVVFRLDGGNEDNDLWVEQASDEDGHPVLRSTWELTATERTAILAGGTIELMVWGSATPPVALRVGEAIKPRGEATTV